MPPLDPDIIHAYLHYGPNTVLNDFTIALEQAKTSLDLTCAIRIFEQHYATIHYSETSLIQKHVLYGKLKSDIVKIAKMFAEIFAIDRLRYAVVGFLESHFSEFFYELNAVNLYDVGIAKRDSKVFHLGLLIELLLQENLLAVIVTFIQSVRESRNDAHRAVLKVILKIFKTMSDDEKNMYVRKHINIYQQRAQNTDSSVKHSLWLLTENLRNIHVSSCDPELRALAVFILTRSQVFINLFCYRLPSVNLIGENVN